MEKYCTNLEISQTLQKLGVKQESEFYWSGNELYFLKLEGTKKEKKLISIVGNTTIWSVDHYIKNGIVVSAFTVGELGEGLPSKIKSYHLNKDQWVCAREDDGFVTAHTEANARGKMRIYLIENKLMEVVK